MPRCPTLSRRLRVILVPLALAGAWALPAVAGQNAPPQMAQAETGAGGYSQEQLESYAAAVMKVQEVDRAWQPRIEQAQDQRQAEAMTSEATNEMIGEIEAQGLSVEEYNAITQAAEQDQQLYDRIITLLTQAPR